MKSRVKWGVALAVAVAVFAGCAAEPLPVPNFAVESLMPVLTEAQTLAILSDVTDVLDNASAQRDPALLATRLEGPALDVRTSQLKVAAIRDDNDLITVIPDTFQQLIVPISDEWPRTLWAITTVTEQLQPPRLLALEQAGPQDPYRLWGWVQLVAGVTMPAFADPRVGSEEVAADDISLKVTPADAVAQYADLLVNRQNSPYIANFQPLADDPFRAFLATWVDAQETALSGERVEGTYHFTATPSGPIRAIRSADGGAMVMAEIVTAERLEAMAGAILTPQTMTAQALLVGQEFNNILTAEYTDMIALYIPPAGSDGVITLLGYSHIQTGATVGETPTPE